MKKTIACVLTLCMLLSLSVASPVWGAAAETAETTVQPETSAEPDAGAAPQTETPTAVEKSADPAAVITEEPSEGSTPTETSAGDEATEEPVVKEASDTSESDGTDGSEATPTDSAAPEATATAEPTATATPATTAAATTAATATTAAATATATPATTAAATVTAVPAATAAPALEAAAEEQVAQEDVGSGPAWIVEGEHRRFGHLDELLPIAILNNQTIYLCTTGVISLTGYSASELSNVAFGMDEDTLGSDFCSGKSVIISAISPDSKTESNTLYIWIGTADDVPTPAQVLGETVQLNEDESAQLEGEIRVTATDYTADAACTPTFALTAYPELTEGSAFGVVLNDGDAQPLEGDTFAPMTSGVYRFVVLDASGSLTARSIEYPVTYGQPEAASDSQGEGDVEPTETVAGDEQAESTETAATDATETPAPETTATPTPEPTATILTEADVLQSVSLAATEDTQTETPEISVRAYDYVENALSYVTPSFELTGAPSGSGYYYGISINDSGVVRLKSDTYAVTKSGEYTLAFYLMNEKDEAVSASGIYHVIVDYSQAEANSEAWMTVGSVRRYGTLASLLREADSGATIYLLTQDIVALSDATKLSTVTLAADSSFGSGYGVIASKNSPDGASQDGVTYVWVGVDVDNLEVALFGKSLSPTFTVTAVSIGGRTITNGMWVNGNEAITYTITDSMSGNTYSYEASVDGGATFQTLSDGTLSALGLATGTLNQQIIFRATSLSDSSNQNTLTLTVNYDNEAPALICKAGTDNTLSFYAGDAVSGFETDASVNNVTLAAAANPIVWSAHLTYYGQNVYTYAVQYTGAGTIPAGTLGVKDKAGNVTVWPNDITITSQNSATNSGTSTGSSSSGTTTRTVYHSASTYTTVTAYNGVELLVETGEMNTLAIGDQELNLTLSLAGGSQSTDTPTFTADFLDWKGGSVTQTTDASEDDPGAVDTLVLTAQTDGTADAQGMYSWTFDGSVYKKLAASGIDYLVLTVGDNVTAISTAGFAAGVRYNMFRAAGMASKEFLYTVSMNDVGDASETDAFQVQVTVNGEAYTLSADQSSEFYYYDLYNGTEDLLSRPFGQPGTSVTSDAGRQG